MSQPTPPVASGRRPDRTLIRGIVSTSLRFRHLVLASAIAMMVLGIGVLPQMRVDVFPEFAPPRVVVQTLCVGLSTSDVEQLVTVPLEQALNGVQGLDELLSKSVPQLSSIEVLFKQGTDLLRARQLVQERLALVSPSLPTWAAPPVMLAPVSATGRAVQIGMTSDTHSLMDLSMSAYWTVRARLLRVPGVANVAIWNERLQMATVQVEPPKMVSNGVSLNDVMDATGGAVDAGLLRFSSGSVIGTGGTVGTPNQALPVGNVQPVQTVKDLADVPVPSSLGKKVTLSDVAVLTEANQPLTGSAIINGKPGLLLVVEKLPWANSVKMTAAVEQAIRDLQPGMPGITFDTHVFQQADFIKLAISNLTQALVLGFLLVVIILFLFLFEWRVALISLLTIPLSLMATMLVLYWRGATINTMTLAGLVIALGAVVDDAIIDVENIVRRLRAERLSGSGRSTASVILEASLEVRSPIVYATLIIVAASIPIFLLQGLTGSFFRPLALSYTLAIVASMAVALTLTPALALLLLRRAPIERRGSPVVRWLQARYTRALDRIVVRPSAAYAAFVVVTLGGLLVVPQLGQSLFPAFKERDFLIHWVALPGTSVNEMERTTVDLNQQLAKLPQIRSIGTHLGSAFLGEEVAGVNLGEAWVSLKPGADYQESLDAIDGVTQNGYPGLYREVQTYLDERIEEVLTGGKEAIVLRVYGEDLDTLRAKSDQLLGILEKVPGVVDAHRDVSTDVPQIEVQVDLAKAERYDLKPGDVRRAAATLMAGEEVGDMFHDGKAYDVVVWSTPQSRADLSSVLNMPLDTPSGQRIRLSDVASVALKPNPNAISRVGDSRYLDVGANVEDRDLGSVVADLNKRLAGVTYERGYHAEVLGEYAERQAAQKRLLVSGVLGGVLILLLLQAAFRSWRLAVLVFATLPMALVGGVLAAWMGGGIISLGSLVGFFTVFGIAARNGILLINHCQHLEREEGMVFGRELVIRGAKERLSPILMTTLATGLALVPLVVLGQRPGHEIEHPLAVVILGGLVTSTLLNLYVLPSLYLRFGRPSPPQLPPAPRGGEALVPSAATVEG
jgi:CzcA family heavy metal efflux pump